MSTIDIATLRGSVDRRILSATGGQHGHARSSAMSSSLTLAWRSMLKLKHVPSQLIEVSVWPFMMILMFTYVFGGAIAGSLREYVQHLIPGMLVLGVAMISEYTALGIHADIQKGILDRFRSISFWRPAVLVGALVGDMVRYTVAGTVVIGLGLLLGFRPGAGVGGVFLALGLVLAFSFSFSWIWTTVGLLMKRAESITMVSSIVNFLLMFISNVFVDPETLPRLLQRYVKINPFGLTVTAVRGLMAGTATATQIGYALLSCGILTVLFAPVAMYLYNNKNAK